MPIIPIVLIALLIAGAFALVLHPLIDANDRNDLGSLVSPLTPTLEELFVRRDAIYAALKDAEFDRETGKLDREDYEIVQARYMAEAAQVLRQIDRQTPEAEAALDAEIERAIAQFRSEGNGFSLPDGFPADLEDAVESEITSLVKHSAASDTHALACPDCGQPYQPGDLYCAACGASLANTCPQCGAGHQPDDAFCARCGTPLAERVER